MNPFKQFNSNIIPLLNAMWNKLEKTFNIRGDNYINFTRVGSGITASLNIEEVRRRIAKRSGVGGGGTLVRRAKATEDAPGSDTIKVNFYDAAGVEITTGTAGEDYDIPVTCIISNGTELKQAKRTLKENTEIFVAKINIDDSGEPTPTWYCVEGFQGEGVTRRATLTADPGSGTTITVNLYSLIDGTEQTSGSEAGITVTCNISGGSDLTEATRRLENNDVVFVEKYAGSWYCVEGFQGTEDCTCEQEDAVFNSVTIAEDQKFTLDGVGGDTFLRKNSVSGDLETTVDATTVTESK